MLHTGPLMTITERAKQNPQHISFLLGQQIIMDLDCETAVDANVVIRDKKDAGSQGHFRLSYLHLCPAQKPLTGRLEISNWIRQMFLHSELFFQL